ncbi:MAG: EamA family transporter [Anaerolineae bacterium]|nr:EamA family transporter [Anaerolineae bacterium]
MLKNRSSHLGAALLALFVTFLWSTSFVLIKVGLADIPPFTFAGLRYILAFLCLLPFALRPRNREFIRGLSTHDWRRLVVLGLLYYAITQGSAFFGLKTLPSATISLLLNFTTIVVALLGVFWLAEYPTVFQWIGVFINVVGVIVYFYPESFPSDQIVGLVVVGVGVLANAGSLILGRRVNREGDIPPLIVTVTSMGVGAIVLLVTGLLTESFPRLDLAHWAIIGWLAVANTAFAFTLWNHTLRVLPAVESSIVNNTMLIQVAVLSWLFLGESLDWWQIVGMILAGLGTLTVQLRSQGWREVMTDGASRTVDIPQE